MLNNNELLFLLVGALALFALGVLLSLLARSNKQGGDDLAQRLEKALPGAQCAQCGFPGCRAYAEAMAQGSAPCNKCTPGGQDTTEALAAILGTPIPTDASDDDIFTPRLVATIHSNICTGCGKCKRHCPVDAIEGMVREAHRINERECIGCNECVKTCPERCIELIRLEPTLANYNWDLHAIRFKRT